MTLKIRLLIMFVGLVFAAAGTFILRGNLELVRGGVKTTGTVVDVDIDRDKDGTTYAPIIEFKDKSGQVQRLTTSFHSSSRPAIGVTKPIVYDPDDPGKGEVDSVMGLYLFPGLFLIAGLLVILLGIFSKMTIVQPAPGMRPPAEMTPPAMQTSTIAAAAQPAANPNAIMPNATAALFGAPAVTPPPATAPPPPAPVPPELAAYVASAKASGSDVATIRQTLIASGWNATDVDNALK